MHVITLFCMLFYLDYIYTHFVAHIQYIYKLNVITIIVYSSQTWLELYMFDVYDYVYTLCAINMYALKLGRLIVLHFTGTNACEKQNLNRERSALN